MNTRRIVLTGLFTACALAVNIAEGALPMPLPGMKLGAANVFALAALVLLGVKEAFAVTLLRVALAWLITGNIFSFFCSLGGALPAVALMALLYGKFSSDFSLPWISVAGALAFNVGQVAVVSFVVGDARVVFYILPLFIAGTAAGWAVGKLAETLCRRLRGGSSR
ncbi:MAG: Gx transporter family protein [Synergistaceae bacterium]|nr:Gx transporter family protein [Synergistaceae bacterium]